MGIIISLIVFTVLRFLWERNRNDKKASLNASLSSRIEEWLNNKNANYFLTSSRDVDFYQFDKRLNACSVNVCIWSGSNQSKLKAEITFPVVVPHAKIELMNDLIKTFGNQFYPGILVLDFQTGRLFFNYEIKLKKTEILKHNEAISNIEELIELADFSFSEIMKVLYGCSIPELASIKIFGFPDAALN